jgi:hypothetical protein
MNRTKLTDSSVCSDVRASTSSQTTASDGRPGAAFSAASAASEMAVSMCSTAIDPTFGMSSSFRSLVLARDVAQDHVALRLQGRAVEVDDVHHGARAVEQLEHLVGRLLRRDDPQVDHGAAAKR